MNWVADQQAVDSSIICGDSGCRSFLSSLERQVAYRLGIRGAGPTKYQ